LRECLNNTHTGIVLHEDVNAKIVPMGNEAGMPLMYQLMDASARISWAAAATRRLNAQTAHIEQYSPVHEYKEKNLSH
jgi:hypothetical protein